MNGALLKKRWEQCEKLPFGKKIFSSLIGRSTPYTGSIPFLIEKCQPGAIEVFLKDRPKIRNHLNSIHAAALFNLAELCTGLAIVSKLEKTQRAIPVKLEIEYLKKARGRLCARSTLKNSLQTNSLESAKVEIFNQKEECVAKAQAYWKIGSQKK